MTVAAMLAASYLLGSIPIGLWIAKAWAGIDVREHGSGNIGATNVYRVVGRAAGLTVFTLDVLKGLAPPLAAGAMHLPPAMQVGAGLAAIVGHTVSPFLHFRGGKGIATSLGVLLGVAWKVGASAWVIWVIVLAATGYVSLGSVIAAAALAPMTTVYYPHDGARLAFAVAAGALAIYRHRANLSRLAAGTENAMHARPASRGLVAVIAGASAIALMAMLAIGLSR